MHIKEIYKAIYRHLDDLTPLPLDCGELCGKLCCSSYDDDETGMYLFPGERVMYEPVPDWAKIQKSGLVLAGEKVDFFDCNGKCNRTLRPLACRIFPLFPYIDIGGELHMIMDPRGKGICPLAKAMTLSDLDGKFVDTVRYISKLMMKNSLLYSYLFDLSRFTDSCSDILQIRKNED